jgi:signal transduction histidine kinase
MVIRRTRVAEFATVLRRAAHPPLGEARFWIIQAMVLLVAGVHLIVDLHVSAETGAFPAGLPVALLILPVGYAALRYGLTGSAATGIWATLAWLPDLLLSHDQGHVGSDLVELALVDVVAFVFGQHLEAERLAHARVASVTAERRSAEVRYRRLFESSRSPILVLDHRGRVADANPAASGLFGSDVVGKPAATLFEGNATVEEQAGQVLCLPDGRDYRLDLVALAAGSDRGSTQVTFEDVTNERSEGRRATRYAQMVVEAEEEQRRRLSRELHDEPLQLFLHLARRLESLGQTPGIPGSAVDALEEARTQALGAAARLRTLARDLRPPSLDELGLVAALSTLLSEVEDDSELVATLRVVGTDIRLAPEIELGAFRIVQEAVRNILRHARASRIAVTLEYGPDSLALEVTDDGRGFETGDDRPSEHLGLLGMRERARLLGGLLDVRSTPGSGTVVQGSVPLGPNGASTVDATALGRHSDGSTAPPPPASTRVSRR